MPKTSVILLLHSWEVRLHLGGVVSRAHKPTISKPTLSQRLMPITHSGVPWTSGPHL